MRLPYSINKFWALSSLCTACSDLNSKPKVLGSQDTCDNNREKCSCLDCVNNTGVECECQRKQKAWTIVNQIEDLKHTAETTDSETTDSGQGQGHDPYAALCHCDWGRTGHSPKECWILNLKDEIEKLKEGVEKLRTPR